MPNSLIRYGNYRTMLLYSGFGNVDYNYLFNLIDVLTTEHSSTKTVLSTKFVKSLPITLNVYKLMTANVIYTIQFTVDKAI